MKNYHYYLKQELFSHKGNKRFNGFKWHPEQPMTLYLFGEGKRSTRFVLIFRLCPDPIVCMGDVRLAVVRTG